MQTPPVGIDIARSHRPEARKFEANTILICNRKHLVLFYVDNIFCYEPGRFEIKSFQGPGSSSDSERRISSQDKLEVGGFQYILCVF